MTEEQRMTPISQECRQSLADPALSPFLPMLYVAWADGDLSTAELAEIRARLDGGRHACLAPWLDPENPPSAADLRALLRLIRQGTRGLDSRQKLSLVGLGLELAQAGDHQVSAEERHALEEIQEVLGIASHEAARQLLASRRPAASPRRIAADFDVAAMTALLDGKHGDICRQVRAVIAGMDLGDALDRDSYRDKILADCRILAARGIGGLSFPEAYGGSGDRGGFVAAMATLGHHDLSLMVKAGVQFGLFGGSVLNLGTQRHHQTLLPRIASLELPGCFAMTETGHGSNVQDLETTATYDAATEEFIIHTPHHGARKDYIGNAARHGQLATVFAQLDLGDEAHGVHAFLVPIRHADGTALPGVAIEDCGTKVGLNGVDNGRLSFDQVRIPRTNLLDRFASVDAEGNYSSPIASPSRRFFTMLGTLVGGRVTVAAVALSAAKSGLTVALRYSARRRQFGPPGKAETTILDYLTHQRRLLPLLATSYALHFALDDLRDHYADSDVSDDRRALEAAAAGLKAYSTWHTMTTLQTCRECCGGQGYLAVNRLGRWRADADIFTTFEGDNIVLLQLLAKALLTGYQKQFGDLDFFKLMRFLARQSSRTLAQLDPIGSRRTDADHLRGRDFQSQTFRYREEHLLAAVARRLKKRIDSGMESHQALIECQDHLVETALAHVERVLLDSFYAHIGACAEPTLRQQLTTLCDLFALWRIEQDRGWFLEHGYFEGGKAKAIRKLVNRLCGEVRQQAVPLVDAFAIPKASLAPIAI